MVPVRSLTLLALASLLAACSAVGEGPPCAAPESYPVCASARTGVLSCEEGEEVFAACAEGLTCLDVVDPASGARLSECLPPYSIQCDPASFQAACVDPGTLLACVAPATAPGAGHTERLACGTGEVCRLEGDHGACLPPIDPTTCDAATFPGACRDGAPVACVDGTLAVGDPCGEGELCQVTPEGARCVPEPVCDPPTWTPTCASETAIRICAPPGTLVDQPCPLHVPSCAEGPNGAVCVPPDAEPCDPATFVPFCETMGRRVFCNPDTGFSDIERCGRMARCVEGADGAACQ